MTFIYALADPKTDEIRYVGKADSVKERFTSHMREANALMNRIATTMVGLAQTRPEIVPKRWMAIQLP